MMGRIILYPRSSLSRNPSPCSTRTFQPAIIPFPRTHYVGDANVVAQYFSTPAIVIARDPQYFDAGVRELREGRERAKAPSRDHRLPLEPEVEQVAVYHERSRLACEPTEKGDERALCLRTGNSEVRVRYDVTGAVEHGTS